jgi:uncharacterized protein YihD (DUF1040 family)
MRDPNRIPRIIEKLSKTWQKTPDLRLGQLVEIIYSKRHEKEWNLFNLEDDAFEQALEKLEKEIKYIYDK